MKHRWLIVAALLAVTLGLAACSESAEELGEASGAAGRAVVSKETGLSKVTLTREAYERLAITTSPVTGVAGSGQSAPTGLAIVPSSAVLYDAQGDTWTYISLRKQTFERAQVTVDHFQGRVAYLKDGPAPGTAVVTVGVPELFGIEQGVEGE